MTHVMLVCKGYRYRVYPTPEQAARLRRWEDALRFLWNLALEQRKMGLARSREERVYLTAFDQQRELTALRAELPWLSDVPREVSAHLLVVLDQAWQRCFMRVTKAPGWKRKGERPPSFTAVDRKSWWIRGSAIRFPKLGALRAVVHRPLDGTPRTCTLRRDGDQWFVCILCDIEIPDPAPRHEPIVAIDRGVVNVVADSDGRIIQGPRFYAKDRKSQAVFECVGCGNVEHADTNASLVLLSRANRSAQPVEGSPLGALRSRKRLRVPRDAHRSSGPSAPG